METYLSYKKHKAGAGHDKPATRLLLAPPLVLLAAVVVLLFKYSPSRTTATFTAVTVLRTRSYSILDNPRTDAPMAVLPPFQPTCFVIHEERVKVQCPVIDCSLDTSCTASNKSCCAYVNLQIMLFFDQYLASNGFEGQYTLVYGSVIGAVRNQTVLPHTGDVDFGISPRVAQFLERNSTRQEIWSYGYSVWADNTVWRMCPHRHHPSSDLQSLMKPLHAMNHYKQAELIGAYAGAGWLDGFLIWPVAGADTDCTVADTSLDLDRLLSTASSSPAAEDRASLQQRGNPAVSRSLAEASTQRTKGSMGQHFCIHHGAVPVLLKPGSRPANVAGHQLPAPEDMEGHVEATYGPNWRTPDLAYHGADPATPDVDRIRAALHQKLSVTAWGDMPWDVRKRHCNKRG